MAIFRFLGAKEIITVSLFYTDCQEKLSLIKQVVVLIECPVAPKPSTFTHPLLQQCTVQHKMYNITIHCFSRSHHAILWNVTHSCLRTHTHTQLFGKWISQLSAVRTRWPVLLHTCLWQFVSAGVYSNSPCVRWHGAWNGIGHPCWYTTWTLTDCPTEFIWRVWKQIKHCATLLQAFFPSDIRFPIS